MALRVSRRGGAALILLLALVVQAPFMDRGLALLDEGTVTANADALARGDVLYRDRITLVAPLSYELVAAGYRWFGAHVAVGRGLQAALFAGCVLLSFAVLRRTAGFGWAFAGALLLLALKPLGYLSWTIANYSPLGLFALLLALAALARWLDERRRADLALAGLASGLVFVAKQNLAAVAALAVGASVLAAWWASPPRRLGSLFASAGLLLAAALAPVGAAALRYAQLGALDAAFEQAVVGLAGFADAWRLPFPPLAPWSDEDPRHALRIFSFFPQPVVEAALGGRTLPRALYHGVEWAVKLCYALPLLAIALLGVRWLREPSRRAERSVSLACALFAAGAYASMWYRPDWAHLMNVWPLLHVAICAALAGERGRLQGALAAVAASAWLGLAAVSCWALVALDWQTVRTPRGELRVAAVDAPALRAVLAWDAERPPAERIAFLPAASGLHFLSGRPLPLAVDALTPGVFRPSDEERMLRQLDAVERVVFDARPLPWVRGDVVDVVPRLARALATQFRFTEQVAPGFFAFARATPAADAPRERVDLAAEASGDGVTPEHWLFHRVLAWDVAQRAGRACAESAWRAAPGDRIVATPMTHPVRWGSADAEPGWLGFELAVLGPDRTPVATRTEQRAVSAAPEAWTLPVALPAGSEASLRICVWRVANGAGMERGALRAGWAEPRVERRTGG
jgi:hypothetical protein